MLKKLILIIFSLLLFILDYNSIYSQNLGGVSVVPSLVEVNTSRGETKEEILTIFNNTNTVSRVTISVKDFILENNQIRYLNQKYPTSSVSMWTEVPDSKLTLLGNSQKDISLKIIVPKDAEFGEHSALISVLFENTDNANKGVSINSEILPVLYVTVGGGNFVPKLKWEAKLKRNIFSDSATLEVHNSGNVHTILTGRVVYTPILGYAGGKFSIPETNIIPGDTKKIMVAWEDGRPLTGIYRADIQLNNKNFSYKFIIIPWILLFIVIVIIATAIFGIRVYIAREIKKARSK